MGLGFNWFKKYEIEYNKILYYDEYRIKLIDSYSTSHSYHNSWLVTDLFWKTFGLNFPKLPNEDWIDSEDYQLELIEPKEMSKYCEIILSGNEVDEIDMRDRFEWFKKYSDEGYYIAYDFQ